MVKFLFWFWLIALFVLNVIPLGNGTSESLSGNRLVFRLDYLMHMMSFLGFAWIVLLGQVSKHPVFDKREGLMFSLVVIIAACAFEMVQLALPYRSFNPVDLLYNLIGAVAGVCMVKVSRRSSRIKTQID